MRLLKSIRRLVLPSGTLPVLLQTAWFEVLTHNAEAVHSGRTNRNFVLRASCTTSSFVYRRWTDEDSAKTKTTRDLCKKWGVILDSVEPSLIVFDGGMLLNNLSSGDTFASFSEYVLAVKLLTNNAKNAAKRPKIQTTKEMRLQTTSEIFFSIQPTSKGYGHCCWFN